MRRLLVHTAAAVSIGCAGAVAEGVPQPQPPHDAPRIVPSSDALTNWSGTHVTYPGGWIQADTGAQVQAALDHAHATRQRLRVTGSCMSPNGIGMPNSGQVGLSLAGLDEVVLADAKRGVVVVGAGARIADVVAVIRKEGWTLQNFASVLEQQMGGFISAGAHGTGARIPPVDQQVVGFTLATPGRGTVHVQPGAAVDTAGNPLGPPELAAHLFDAARVSLGALGVLTSVTLQCVPLHVLEERTQVLTHADVARLHARLLADNRHVRYMWIPYTDKVVVVSSNPVDAVSRLTTYTSADALEPFVHLLQKLGDRRDVTGLSFAALRDRLLEHTPLDPQHVRTVNRAEAQFWTSVQGIRRDLNDKILSFDCGGSQWVLEIAFPVDKPGKELEFMQELLRRIEQHDIPAPAPIEQRWTSASSSWLSPAHHPDPSRVFSWVGIIMYLPTDDAAQRAAITARFSTYAALFTELAAEFGGKTHWAKLEMPQDAAARRTWSKKLAADYPMGAMSVLKAVLDPRDVLTNDFVDAAMAGGSTQ